MRTFERYISRLIAYLLLSVSVFAVRAEEILRPVAAAYTVETGSMRVNDTYLTPLEYNGMSVALSYERYQAMKFSPQRWVQNLKVSAGFGSTRNPARNANILQTGISASWAMMHRWDIKPAKGLALYAGGEAEADLGVLYLSRNSNNPATAKAAFTVGAAGMAVYNFKVRGLPVTLRWRSSLPLLGTFFSQQYGELYYEIYLGDRSGLACFANPATYFRFCNVVTADLRFGSTWVRVGYCNNLTSTRIHHLTTNISAHSFVIGLAGEWLSLNSRRVPGKDARIVSAIY